MSCSLEFSPKSSPINTTNNFSSSSQSYNDLINYCSIRKQFFRIIPQYMNINNKKLISQKKSSSSIEEYRKYKQEIISLKESIALLKEKKQKKLEQIEELRCLMRKVGNKQYNNYSKNNNINNYHHDRETKEQRNNDQRFRCNPNNDKKQQCCFDTTKGTSEDVEGGLSLMPPEKMKIQPLKVEIIQNKIIKVILFLVIVVVLIVYVIRIVGAVVLPQEMQKQTRLKAWKVIYLHHCLRKRTEELCLCYLDKIIKLNAGNEKTFWFNLIIIIKDYFTNLLNNFNDIIFFPYFSLLFLSFFIFPFILFNQFIFTKIKIFHFLFFIYKNKFNILRVLN